MASLKDIPKHVIDKYKEGKFASPPSAMSDEDRDAKYYLDICRSFFNDFICNRTAFPYETKNIRSIEELRAYGQGVQSPDKYKKILCRSKFDQDDTNPLNISWDAPRIMPKFRDVIKGIAMDIDFEVGVIATDPTSQTTKEKERAYNKVQASGKFKEFKKMIQELGVPTDQPEMEFDNPKQVDVFFESGAFKLGIEIAATACIIQSQNLSDFDGSIKENAIEDLIDLGFVTLADTTTANGEVKSRYVDPASFTCSYSDYKDYRNIDRCAELRMMTIRELRSESNLSEEEIISVARKYATNYNNSRFSVPSNYWNSDSRRDSFDQRFGSWPIDNFVVPVLQVCFIAKDVETYTRIINKKGGNVVMNQVHNNYKLSKKDKKEGKEIITSKVEYTYECKWVPGTDFVFDYGKSDYCVRNNQLGINEVRLPYQICKTATSSIVERCVPIIDDIAIATFKFRESVARLPPAPRMVIDQSLLENLMLGDKKMKPIEALDLFGQTGVLYVKSLDDFQEMQSAATLNPINFLPSGISEDLQIFTAEINTKIDLLRQVTGINELVDGSTPPDRTAVGVAELATGATNNTLKTLFRCYETAFKNNQTNCLKRWQLLCQKNKYKGKVQAIGEMNYKTIELTKDFALADFGLFIKPAATAAEKQQLIADITNLRNMNVTNGGAGGITPEMHLKVYTTIKSGNIPMAQKLLREAMDEQREKDRQREMENIQANAQVQQQSSQAAEAERRATLQQEHTSKMREMAFQAYLDAQLMNNKGEIEAALKEIDRMFAPQGQQQQPNIPQPPV